MISQFFQRCLSSRPHQRKALSIDLGQITRLFGNRNRWTKSFRNVDFLLKKLEFFFKNDDRKWTYSTYKDFKVSQTLQNQELSKFSSCQFYQRTRPHARTTEEAENHGAQGIEHIKG